MEPDYKKKDRTAQPKPKTCKELHPNGSEERLACCAAGNKTTWSGNETTGTCKCNDSTKEWKNGTCVAKPAPKTCTPACSATQICTDGICVDTQETINAKIAECEKDILKEWKNQGCVDKHKEYVNVPYVFTTEQAMAFITENQTCKNVNEGNGILSQKQSDQNTYEVVCKKSTVYYLTFKKPSVNATTPQGACTQQGGSFKQNYHRLSVNGLYPNICDFPTNILETDVKDKCTKISEYGFEYSTKEVVESGLTPKSPRTKCWYVK